MRRSAAGRPAADERRAYEQLAILYARRRAYASFMAARPQTLYALADSPVGLAAWLLDHGDGWGQPAAPVTSAVLGHTSHGHPAGELTRDDVLDNITLYWLTNTAVSAARLYWENMAGLCHAADVSVPAAVSAFPGENYQAPRSWTERAYHNLIYYNQPAQGGHFATWSNRRSSPPRSARACGRSAANGYWVARRQPPARQPGPGHRAPGDTSDVLISSSPSAAVSCVAKISGKGSVEPEGAARWSSWRSGWTPRSAQARSAVAGRRFITRCGTGTRPRGALAAQY